MTRRLSRVLVLLPSAGLGGAEVQTAILAADLLAAGVDIRLAIAAEQAAGFARLLGPGFATRLHAAPIEWREVAPPGANIARQSAAAADLLAVLRPDAALLPLPWPSHGLGLMQALAGTSPGVSPGTPTLAIAHLAPQALPPAEAALARAAPAVHWAAVSAPIAARIEAAFALPPGRVACIPNGMPPPSPADRVAVRAARRAQLGLPPEAKLLVFAGRLDVNKGADLLPGLAAALAGQARIVVLGAGGLRLEGAGLHLLGRVTDVPDWLLAADALLLPSRLEGCPLVFLEAALRRCPVIATAAALEAFADAASLAWLASSPGIARLAERAREALAMPDARRTEAAFRHAAGHDQAAMLGQYRARLRALFA